MVEPLAFDRVDWLFFEQTLLELDCGDKSLTLGLIVCVKILDQN